MKRSVGVDGVCVTRGGGVCVRGTTVVRAIKLGYRDDRSVAADEDADDEAFEVAAGDEHLIIPPTTDENAIKHGRELSLWAALALSAVMYSVPYGFVRWNLHTLAPLLWYELGGATLLGTLMAMPFVSAIGYPAAKYGLNMPILARSSFGIWGAEFADFGRAVLGFLLYAVQTLVGGEAVFGLFKSTSIAMSIESDVIVRGAAYAMFWVVQLALSLRTVPATRLIGSGQAVLAIAAGFVAWAVRQGIPQSTLSATLAAGMPSYVAAEFWKHAWLMVGVWVTLASVYPDYTARIKGSKTAPIGQFFWLPILSGIFAIIASAMAKAPPPIMFASLTVASLVTNSASNVVGPQEYLQEFKLPFSKTTITSKQAAIITTVAVGLFAPASLMWEQTVAAASWIIGVGSLLVSPVLGVILCDYWLMRGGKLSRKAMQTRDPNGPYWFFNGVNPRAMIAITVAAAPNFLSLLSGMSYLIQAGAFSGNGTFYTYVVNMEYASIIGAVIAFIVYLFIHLLERAPKQVAQAAISVGEVAQSVTTSVTAAVDGATRTTTTVTREMVAKRAPRRNRETLPNEVYHDIDKAERERRADEDRRRREAEEALERAIQVETELRRKENSRRRAEKERIDRMYEECEAIYEEEIITTRTVTEKQKNQLNAEFTESTNRLTSAKDRVVQMTKRIEDVQSSIETRRRKADKEIDDARRALEAARIKENELRAKFEAQTNGLNQAEARVLQEEERRRNESEANLRRLQDQAASQAAAEEQRRRAWDADHARIEDEEQRLRNQEDARRISANEALMRAVQDQRDRFEREEADRQSQEERRRDDAARRLRDQEDEERRRRDQENSRRLSAEQQINTLKEEIIRFDREVKMRRASCCAFL
jgi:cytosine/uracil/thiamine/allantoin permease